MNQENNNSDFEKKLGVFLNENCPSMPLPPFEEYTRIFQRIHASNDFHISEMIYRLFRYLAPVFATALFVLFITSHYLGIRYYPRNNEDLSIDLIESSNILDSSEETNEFRSPDEDWVALAETVSSDR